MFTAKESALLEAAAEATRTRLDRAVEALELRQHRDALKEIKASLFDVEFRVRDALERQNLSATESQEPLELVLNCPPGALLAECRLETAAVLLRHADLSGERVGELVAYSIRQAFERSFRSWAAVTPSEYRRLVHDLPGFTPEMLAFDYALRVRRGELSGVEARQLFFHLWSLLVMYCGNLRGAGALDLERGLAEELLAKCLAGEHNSRLLVLCRRYFTTPALEDVLGEAGWVGD